MLPNEKLHKHRISIIPACRSIRRSIRCHVFCWLQTLTLSVLIYPGALQPLLAQTLTDGLQELTPLNQLNKIKPSLASLNKGINFAGDFEVSPRAAWGTRIQPDFFTLAKQAGFDHVRIPIRWSAHTTDGPEYSIDSVFFQEVDGLIRNALQSELSIIINNHHFEELDQSPVEHRPQLLAIWQQIAKRYQSLPASLIFEINNEPVGVFNDKPEIWNKLLAETLQVIRSSNPERAVIVGPVDYHHPSRLEQLQLPADNNLIVTIHTYDPGTFTHQQAPWLEQAPPAGSFWHPDQLTLDSKWQDTSWDTNVHSDNEALHVNFKRQFSAFSITNSGSGSEPMDTLVIRSDKALEASIICNVHGLLIHTEFSQFFTANDGNIIQKADLKDCGRILSLSIQSTAAQATSVKILGAELCNHSEQGSTNCSPIIVTQRQIHQQLMKISAAWAEAQGVPIYLGEFGVYDDPVTPVDKTSRKAWIQSVRTAAERHNIGWAFFELSNEFGAYDHIKRDWNQDILDALFD